MTKRDFEKSNLRKKRALLADAARELPNVRKAMFPGRCPECSQPYPKGQPIVHDGDQWLHPQCRIDRAARQASERAARKVSTPSR